MKPDPEFKMEDQMKAYDHFVSHLTACASSQYRSLLKKRLEAMDITFPEFNIVGMLLRHLEGLSQKKLARLLELTPATVSVALEKLERKKVVTRHAVDGDSRVKKVRVNLDTLRQGGEEIHRMLLDLETAALQGVSPRDAATAMKVLQTMNDNFRNLHPKGENA